MGLVHILTDEETKSEMKGILQGSGRKKPFSADPTSPVVHLWSKHQNHQQGLLECLLLGPIPRGQDSVGLRGGLRICIFTKFPGDVDAAGPGTPL